MPNSRFTPTEDLLAKRIAKQYRLKGYSSKDAKSIGYATVNKMNTDKQFQSNVEKRLSMLDKGKYILTRVKPSKQHIRTNGKDILVS